MVLIDDAQRLNAANVEPEIVAPPVDPLSEHAPHLSARTIVTAEQKRALTALVAVLGAAAILAFKFVLWALALSIGAIVASMVVLRYAAALAPRRSDHAHAGADDILPLYTILCPAYREALALPGLVAALDRLDYPRERLDVIILTEPGDATTRAAAEAAASSRAWIRVVEAPTLGPRTKPKALSGFGRSARRYSYRV